MWVDQDESASEESELFTEEEELAEECGMGVEVVTGGGGGGGGILEDTGMSEVYGEECAMRGTHIQVTGEFVRDPSAWEGTSQGEGELFVWVEGGEGRAS